jgi:hypothetical protein
MTKFSVTKNGKVLDPSLYNWDEKTKTFSSNEDGLVLDFTGVNRVTFNTSYSNKCTFKTGSSCTFITGDSCTFNTGFDCTFKTYSYCTFITDFSCIFNTGSYCTFKTGSDCTFYAGFNCTFEVGKNCSLIRCDVKGVTEIPTGKKIKLNDHEITGYTVIEEKIEEKKEVPTCNCKVVVEIDGKKYKLTEIKE